MKATEQFHKWWDTGEHGCPTDHHGAEYTLARDSFLAANEQIERLERDIQSWKDGHAVQEHRHKEVIEQIRASNEQVLHGLACIRRDGIFGSTCALDEDDKAAWDAALEWMDYLREKLREKERERRK